MRRLQAEASGTRSYSRKGGLAVCRSLSFRTRQGSDRQMTSLVLVSRLPTGWLKSKSWFGHTGLSILGLLCV